MKTLFLKKMKKATSGTLVFALLFSLFSPIGNMAFADQATAIATIDGVALGGGATGITMEILTEAGATGTISQNLVAYQAAIAAADDKPLMPRRQQQL